MTEPNKPLEQMTAQERLDLGRSYYNKDKFDEAIKACSSIHREEVDPETYAQAQLGLGAAYYAQSELDQASIEVTYNESSKMDQAIEAWSNIRRSDDSEIYAQAQFNLGVVYAKSGEPEQAIKTWSNIRRRDDPEAYAQAQLGLGAAYYAQEDWKQAIKTWSKIRRRKKITPETYARAQLCLGNTYKDQGNPEQAIKIWSNIRHKEAAPETYADAQLGLGEVYSLDKETEKQSHKAYDNVRDFSYYKSERGFKILKCPVEVRKNLHTVADNTDKVLKYLQIIPAFESKVAHYTRPQIAFNLFGDEKTIRIHQISDSVPFVELTIQQKDWF